MLIFARSGTPDACTIILTFAAPRALSPGVATASELSWRYDMLAAAYRSGAAGP